MKPTFRILLAEDHRILREGLKSMLSAHPAYAIVGEAENGLEAVRFATELKPDLVLLDLSMPKMNGLDAIREIRRLGEDIRVMILTVHKTEEYVFEAFNAGADGYLLKDATKAELMLAVESVLDGRRYVSPGISNQLVQAFLNGRAPVQTDAPWEKLTNRERQILKLIAEGHTNHEISEYLCISVKTVETHRGNLMKKLDLHNASEMTAFAIRKGLVAQ